MVINKCFCFYLSVDKTREFTYQKGTIYVKDLTSNKDDFKKLVDLPIWVVEDILENKAINNSYIKECICQTAVLSYDWGKVVGKENLIEAYRNDNEIINIILKDREHQYKGE